MSSTVRVNTGDVIHVRTGVVQGIGPQGPRGPIGPEGPPGPQGPQGEKGDTGFIEQVTTEAVTSEEMSLASGSWALATLDNPLVDDFSAVQSATNFVPGVGPFYISAYVNHAKPTSANGSGLRGVRILVGGTVVAGDTRPAATTIDTEISLNTGCRITDDAAAIQVQVFQSQGVSTIYTARLWITKVGPGARGPVGPEGPAGPIGPEGPQGPQGPAGTGANSSTTFAMLEAN